MNPIRQRLISLRSRARHVQTSLTRWGAYAAGIPHEDRDAILSSWTPGEQSDFQRDHELARHRLKPVHVHIETLGTWFSYVLETIETELNRAQTLLDQGRQQECQAILADVEARLVTPNGLTLAFTSGTFTQRIAPATAHRMTALDAIIRGLYLPTIRIAHQRGLLTKESLSRSPLAALSGGASDAIQWRQHVYASAAQGRYIPITLACVPQSMLGEPWSLVSLGFEVGVQVCADLDLAWELAHKLSREAPLTGASAQTAPLWARWHETLFADVFGVLKLGPAYVSGMIELLSAAPAQIFAFDPSSATPPAYIRWHIMLQTLHLLSYADEARERFNQIHLICGDPNQAAAQIGSIWTQLVNEARSIAGLIAFSPLQRLGGARVIDVTPPFLTGEIQSAIKVRDVLLGGDESISSDADFDWASSLRDVPAHLALAGLRMAFDAAGQTEAAERLNTRFWCLMQFLTRETSSTREREDREYAPGQEALKYIAQRAVPAAVA